MTDDSDKIWHSYYDSVAQKEVDYTETIHLSKILFADTTIHQFELEHEVVDTVFQINPVTPEEEAVVQQYHSLPYNIDAGKIPLLQFRNMLRDSVSFPECENIAPDFPEVEIASADRHAYSWYDYEANKRIPPDVKTGDHVIVLFYIKNTITGGSRPAGKVLFEII